MKKIGTLLCVALMWCVVSSMFPVKASLNKNDTEKVTVENDDKKGGYVYFSTSQGKIWKMSTKTGRYTCIWDPDLGDSEYNYNITCVGNALYYIKTDTFEDIPCICRLDIKKRKETKICLGEDMHIYNGKIYYRSFTTEDIDWGEEKSKYRSGIKSMDLDGSNKTTIFTKKYCKNLQDYHILDGKIYYSFRTKKGVKVYRANLTGKPEAEVYTAKRNDDNVRLTVWDKNIYIMGPEAKKGWYGLYELNASKKDTKNLFTYRETDSDDNPTFERKIVSVKSGWIYMVKTTYKDGKANLPTLLKYRTKDDKKVTVAELSEGHLAFEYLGNRCLVETVWRGGDSDSAIYFATSLFDLKNGIRSTIDEWSICP